jgi:exopolyphosphatase/guanosine-5'-triphosphate,3'-diphosphate pyrophosphatase
MKEPRVMDTGTAAYFLLFTSYEVTTQHGMPMDDRDNHAACIVPERDYAANGAEHHPTRICVIDLGTNSFHTLIVDVYPNGSFEVIDRLKETVRLGERGLADQRLTERAMKRSVRAIHRVRLLAEGWGATDYLAFATSAIREAANGGELIERIRNETGVHVRAIDGVFEAQLIYQGVRRAFDLPHPALLVDIGGGSTEFVIGSNDEVYFATSMKLGAARMTGQFIRTDPVGRKEFDALRGHYRETLAPVFAAAREYEIIELVGSSGTFENVAQVCAHLSGDGLHSIFLDTIDVERLRQATKIIMESTRAERARMHGIDEKRVDQIVAGAMLIDVMVKDLGIERVRVSPNALREGMVVYFIRQNYERLEVVSSYSDVRHRSVYEIGHRFGWDQKHVQHVTAIALQLFDVCRPLHRLDRHARELLEYASLLHDIGYYISRSSHHKHSLYLIKQADWAGFQPYEIDVMANVARYHRRSLPKDRHSAYRRLADEHKRLVERLGAFLRLANGLDRSHFQNVEQLEMELDGDELRILIRTKSDPQLEVWGGSRASDLFTKTFGIDVRISAKPMPSPMIDSASGVTADRLVS